MHASRVQYSTHAIIILQILAIIGCLVWAILLIIAAVALLVHENDYRVREYDSDNRSKRAVAYVSFATAALLLIIALVEIFFVYVIVRCYRYLKELAR